MIEKQLGTFPNFTNSLLKCMSNINLDIVNNLYFGFSCFIIPYQDLTSITLSPAAFVAEELLNSMAEQQDKGTILQTPLLT